MVSAHLVGIWPRVPVRVSMSREGLSAIMATLWTFQKHCIITAVLLSSFLEQKSDVQGRQRDTKCIGIEETKLKVQTQWSTLGARAIAQQKGHMYAHSQIRLDPWQHI